MTRNFFDIKIVTSTIAGVATFYFLQSTTLPAPQIYYQQTPETGEMIVVNFPSSVDGNKALKSFSISPSIKGELQWLNGYNEMRFIPFESFDPNTSYTVTIKRPAFLFAKIAPDVSRKTFQPKGLPTKFNTRVPGDPTIYYITESGLKRPTTLDVFYSYPNNKESDIKTIDKESLNLYPDNTLVHLNKVLLYTSLKMGSKDTYPTPKHSTP